jgi:hypothetical protein
MGLSAYMMENAAAKKSGHYGFADFAAPTLGAGAQKTGHPGMKHHLDKGSKPRRDGFGRWTKLFSGS